MQFLTPEIVSKNGRWTILEASSLRSRRPQGWFLLEAVREHLFHASLLASGGLLATFDIPCITGAPS